MRRCARPLAASLGLVFLCFAQPWPDRALAAAGQAFSVDAVSTTTPPKVDGTLDDPTWKTAAHVQLGWDYSFQRPASDQTDAYLLFDAHFAYVAIVAEQKERITATLRTNNVTLAADDVVRIYLWPSGDHGFEYIFGSTPIGTRNQISTENSAFTPEWTAVGKRTNTGYIVTMRVPLGVMRGDGRKSWRLQFDRHITATNQTFEWSHDPSQRSTDDTRGIGHLEHMTVAGSSTRTKPRVSIYTLGQIGAKTAGGSTSRMGADFAVPITPTASFFGTLHPDYSNVELDQQSISPTAFPRQFQEIRPFFTQGANFYNNFNCNDCIDFPLLYTPNIPTPREGFAAEGVQGLLQFAGFDAIEAGRTDSAQVLTFKSSDRRLTVIGQRESVTTPGLIDDLTLGQVALGNAHNFSGYLTLGTDRGTNVTNTALGNMSEFGLNFYNAKAGFFPAYHHNGALFAPADAFVTLTDVTGPSLYTYKEFDFSPTSYIQSVTAGQDIQRYHNRFGALDYTNDGSTLTIVTRKLYTLALSSGSQYLLLSDGTGALINQNGAALAYGNQTSMPTSVSYNVGRFANGYLRSTTRSTTLKAGPRGTVTLEADDTDYTPDTGRRKVQWLERASFAYHMSADSSIAVGLRRIIGTAPPLTPQPQTVNASNVSFAFYKKFRANELYVVYGNPAALATKPALIVKFIHYFGAEKGV